MVVMKTNNSFLLFLLYNLVLFCTGKILHNHEATELCRISLYKERAFHFKHTHTFILDKHITKMSHNAIPSFLNLPVELIYRILDNLTTLELLFAVRDVCTRLNDITDTYHPYQVTFTFITKPSSSISIKWAV